MVARAGGCYRVAFKGDPGVTQVDPLSPTIFNVVVDAVVRHWVTVMVEGAEERGESGQEGRHHNALFYADNGVVAFLDPQWLQGAFSTLVGLFDRVGLRTNVRTTVGMVCLPYQAAGTQSEAAYGQRMTVEGPTYRERQKGRMQCRECGEDMATGSLAGHRMTQHGRDAEEIWIWKTSATGGDPRTYRMDFSAKGDPRRCPVEGCLGRTATRTAMRVNFIHRHVLDTVVILEDGNTPHTRCLRCNILVT